MADELRPASWWYRNQNYMSPGGLLQEGLFRAGLGQTGPGYDTLRRAGGAVDTLMGVFGALPMAGRAVLGRAGMAGHDASMADWMMRNMPADVIRGAPGHAASHGVANPRTTAADGTLFTSILGPAKPVTGAFRDGRKLTTEGGSDVMPHIPPGHGPLWAGWTPGSAYVANDIAAISADRAKYLNALLAQRQRQGFGVVDGGLMP